MGAGLYEAYVTSMDEARAHTRSCWRVIAYRADKVFGRWELVLGTGRSLGPFDTPTAAMERAVIENNALIDQHVAHRKDT